MDSRHVLPLGITAILVVILSYVVTRVAPAGERGETVRTQPAPDTRSAIDEPDAGPAAAGEQGESDYARELERTNAAVAAQEHLAESHGDDWAHLEGLARLYMARAQLTGDHEDYVRAQSARARAFALAAEGAGPVLVRAQLSFTLHRLPNVEADLAAAERAVLLRRGEREMIDSLRADVAFHSGRYEEALAGFRAAHDADPHGGSAFRLALYFWQTGQFPEAERWMQVAEATAEERGRARAWYQLQQGLMDLDRGRYDDAYAHYRRANELFTGWWLVEEHIAEVQALRGHAGEAESRYRDLIERTGNPEFMDALASLISDRDPEEAARWTRRATEHYDRWLERLPEASYGHALEHFLENGPEARALDLAERNFALRPGGAGAMRLAQARLHNGRCEDARARVEAVLATVWRHAALHATAARIYARCGTPEQAAEQGRLGEAIHPRAMDEASFLDAE